MIRFSIWRWAVPCLAATFFLTVPVQAQSTYTNRDAGYVTSSPNPTVLQYVVCLEAAVGASPRRMSPEEALIAAADQCRMFEARLPGAAGDPDAASLQAVILECGFRPGDASPDMDCGQPADHGPAITDRRTPDRAQGDERSARPGRAETLTLTPTVYPVGKWAEGIASDGNFVWVAESGERSIARVHLERGGVDDRVRVGRLPVDMAATRNGDVFAMVNTDKLIWRQTSQGQGSVLTRFTECPNAMVSDGTTLWALMEPECSSEGSRLIRIDPRTGAQSRTGDLGEWGQALTAFRDQIWVAHARGPAFSIVNSRALDSTDMRVDDASLWAATANTRNVFGGGRLDENNGAGLVVMIDPDRRIELERATVDERVAEMICDDSHVVAIGEKGTIWVFSARDLRLLRTIRLSTGVFAPHGVIINDGQLFISGNAPQAETGSILAIRDWRP